MTESQPNNPRGSSNPVVGRTTPGSEPPAAAATEVSRDRQDSPRRSGSRLRPAALAALITGVTVGVLVAVFAAQNSQSVEVHFLGYSTQSAPQFLIILLSVLLGLVIGLLLGLPRGRRRRT
ncbi:MAG: hypothetical protein NVSMB29_13530 [Candidatus Dormibacteria bacterium]